MKERIISLLSLIPTPLLIFITTSLDLYARNREDLGNDPTVLLPFVGLFILALLIGVVLHLLSKYRIPRYLLWLYYLAGPTFLAATYIRAQFPGLLGTPAGLATSAAAVLVAAVVAHKKIPLLEAAKPLALMGILLIGTEAIGFIKMTRAEEIRPLTNVKTTKATTLPNIYHIILDSYQTDLFEATLTEEVKKELRGFVYFPKNTTLFKNTHMVFPAIFTGKSYDYKTPQIDYQKSAFNSNESFLYYLKKLGYSTSAYIQKIYSFDLSLFDTVIEHKNNTNVKPQINLTSEMFNLWLYANTPQIIRERILPSERVKEIKEISRATALWPLNSYFSFQNILEEEKRKGDHGRYEFIHLTIPHPPMILKEDCSYTTEAGEVQNTSMLKQSQCATKLILDFANLLKKLNRFESSLIIVQADHGGRVVVKDGRFASLEYSPKNPEVAWANSRAMLLIKPIGQSTNFYTSEAETTILDIAPTILHSVGIDLDLEGVPLVDPTPTNLKRRRYFHLYSKKGTIDAWTDRMYRFVINGTSVKFDQEIPLTNNPPIKR